MKRRTLLAGGSVALLGGVAGAVVGFEPPSSGDEPRAAYQDEGEIVYDHDDLELRFEAESVHLGDTIAFEVINTGDSKVSLGCHNPWALQRYADGEWRHVTWTGSRYYQMCATELPAGESITERVTFSESSLENQASEVHGELQSGQYRFVLLGSAPFVAVGFPIRSAE